MTLDFKLQKLKEILTSYERILVALSGGVDSAFLLAFSSKYLGVDKVCAITANGPHLAQDEVDYATELCKKLGIGHTIIDMPHLLPIIEPNPQDRCYHCKREIFSTFRDYADSQNYVLCDGTNLDDMNDYRPGHKALQELNVANPLKEADLSKKDIREALHELSKDNPEILSALTLPNGIGIWEKPAFACLASRIPYGEIITVEKLEAIYKAEIYLRSLGFTQVRVRHHGDIARIETTPSETMKLFEENLIENVNEYIKSCGFKYATLDLGGYKMGGGYHDK